MKATAEDSSQRSAPLAVFQKHIVVTCNYEAREFGVMKLMRIDAARRLCRDLILVNGEGKLLILSLW